MRQLGYYLRYWFGWLVCGFRGRHRPDVFLPSDLTVVPYCRTCLVKLTFRQPRESA